MFKTVIVYTGAGVLYIVLGAVIRLIANDMKQLLTRRKLLQVIHIRPSDKDETENEDQ